MGRGSTWARWSLLRGPGFCILNYIKFNTIVAVSGLASSAGGLPSCSLGGRTARYPWGREKARLFFLSFIALAGVGQLDLLFPLFGKVLVPAAVVREVTQAGTGRMSSTNIAGLAWLEQRPVDPPPDRLLAEELGAGEAEVITLALRIGTREVLLDERRARRITEIAYHLPVRGTAGLLVAAKRINLIPSVRPLLEAMRGNGYYLSQRLVDLACAAVWE